MSKFNDADLVLMDDVSGTVITISVARAPRSVLKRVVVFLADGITLWFDSRFAPKTHRSNLFWGFEGHAQRLRLSTHTAQDVEPAEHLVGAERADRFLMPLTLDLTLEPLSRPVRRSSTAVGLQGTQNYRVTGSFAAGSVLYWMAGQAWYSPTGFSAESPADAARMQASFQDASALVAVAPPAKGARGSAALQVHTSTTPMAVADFVVAGPRRFMPQRMTCRLDSGSGVTVLGGRRSIEQHLALVEPCDGGWVRRAYTPFDFVRSGVTGFGILEQVERVDTPTPSQPIFESVPETF